MALLAVVALAFAVQPTATQQPAAGTGREMLEEVAGVRESLDSLVGMLAELLDNQQVELVLKRIDLKQRRLAPLERDLRSGEGSISSRKGELQELAQMLEETEDRIQDQVREGTDHPDSEDRLMARQVEQQIRFLNGQLQQSMGRQSMLMDELADERRELEILDDILRDLLDR
jgi:chromosome segregation ATPase